MEFKDYLLGIRFTLASPLAPDVVADRISAAKTSNINPFSEGVAGWVRFGRISLRWKTALFANGFQPIFSGRIEDHFGATLVHARFGAPWYLQIWLVGWYALLTLVLFASIGSLLSNTIDGEAAPTMLPILVLALLVPLLIHWIFNRNADRHLESILELLHDSAGLQMSDQPLSERD